MRKLYFLIVTIIVMVLIVVSKSGYAQSHDNYYTICTQMDAYYDANHELKDSAESEYLNYIRWKHFWKDRVYSSDTTNNGSFGLIRDALIDYIDHYHYFHRTSGLYNDWHYIGPQGISNNLQVDGLVSAVYVDTINDQSMNTIYVGTNSSGIWKTTNGGAYWVNITDNSNYSIIGINDICGDPAKGEILYAATGGGFMNRSHGYGIGILKSSDRGVTWGRIYPDSMWQNPSSALNVYKIKVDPTNSQKIYALADTMVIRSTDGGNSWHKIFGLSRCPQDQDPTFKRYLRDIEIKPGDPTTLYVASDHRTPENHRQAQVWKLTNVTDTIITNIVAQRLDNSFPPPSGTWIDTTIYTERYAIAVTPSEPDAIYVACTDYPENDYAQARFLLWKFENNQWVRKIQYQINETWHSPFEGC
ncbi:MAG: hypothetical protein NTY96_06565 [Bacteroidetes bacterium]|nr:hypothetical protein [Bacteroidota bacterium]